MKRWKSTRYHNHRVVEYPDAITSVLPFRDVAEWVEIRFPLRLHHRSRPRSPGWSFLVPLIHIALEVSICVSPHLEQNSRVAIWSISSVPWSAIGWHSRRPLAHRCCRKNESPKIDIASEIILAHSIASKVVQPKQRLKNSPRCFIQNSEMTLRCRAWYRHAIS